jgi:hypothetical protein
MASDTKKIQGEHWFRLGHTRNFLKRHYSLAREKEK